MTTKTITPKFNSCKINLCTCINLIFLIILFNYFSFDCTGQITFTVSQPRLSISNGNLKITYDILDANPNDKFNIWLEITDSSGADISANTLKGDIGDSIKAGTNKQIMWNLHADNIFIDNTINVEIIAEKIISEIVPEEEDMSEIPSDVSKKEDIKIAEEPAVTMSKVNVGNNLLKSAIFPGWGLTTLSKGKPYWILGVAGIGCIASSVYFNQKAHSSYDTYLTSSDDDIIDYWQDAVRQGDISKTCAWTAAAIWLADLGIVTIKASSMNKSYRRSRLSAFSISSCIDFNTDTPMLSLKYKF
jgi:hypothetical protein